MISLITKIFASHVKAFGKQRPIGLAEVLYGLVEAYTSDRISLRDLVKLVTEACDLLYSYPDLTYDQLRCEVERAFA